MVRRRSSRCLYKDFVFSNETVLQSSMQQHKPNQNPFLRTALQCHAAIRQSPRKTNFPFQQSFAFSTSYPWTPYASSQVHWPARSHDKASVWIQLLTRFLTKAPHRNWASQHQCQTRLGSSVGMRRTSRLESSWFSSFLIVLLAATQTNVDDCRGPAFPVKSLIISLEDTELLGPLQIQQLWAGSSILKLYKTNKSTWNPPIQPRKQPMFHTWSTTALSFRPLRFEPLLPPDSPGGRVKFPNGNVPRCAMNAFLVKSYHIFKVFDSKDRWKIFRIWFASIWEKHSHKHWTILNHYLQRALQKKPCGYVVASFGWRFRRRWWCGGLRILQPTSIPLDISSMCVWFTRKKKPGNLVAQNRQNPHKKDWKTFKSSTARHPNTSAWTGRFASTHSLR